MKEILRRASLRIATCLADAPEGSAETPYLDAVTLLCHVMGTPKERLFASLDDTVPPAVVDAFSSAVSQRCDGLPVSYIRGEKEFYGRPFRVNRNVP